MKKITITLIALLVSELSFAHSFIAGTYKGNGLWNSSSISGSASTANANSSKGYYQSIAVIDKNKINAHYTFSDGTSMDWNFEIQTKGSTFFDVVSQGVTIGSGYCLEKASVCHYELSMRKFKLEETLVQVGSKIYRYGSKNEGNGPIVWQESLDKE